MILALLVFSSQLTFAQWYVGVNGGVKVSDAYFESLRISTEYVVQGTGAVTVLYLPEGNKPGVNFVLGQSAYGFVENTDLGPVKYTNRGWNFQFHSVLYVPIKGFGLNIELGPAISYYQNPVFSGVRDNSQLPEFNETNVKKLMLDLEGGIGMTQKIGPVHLGINALFVFNASKIYPNMNSMNNPLSVMSTLSLRYRISKVRLD